MKDSDLRQIFYKFKGIFNKGITFIDAHGIEKYVVYNDIYMNSLKMANFFKMNKVKKNSKVVFQIDSVEYFVYCFWACIVSEYYAVPLEPVKNKESRNKVVNVCSKLSDAVMVTTSNQYKNLSELEDKINCKIFVIDKFIDLNFIEGIREEKDLREEIAFIQFSSGSTGRPKGVMLSHKNLISNISAIQNGIKLTNNDIGLSWLPLTHDMGLIGFHLTPACKFIDHVIIDTKAFVFNPILWLKMINKYKATITCSPNFGYKFLLKYMNRKRTVEDYDLSTVRVIFNGAEPISYDVVSTFTEEIKKFKLRSNVIFPVYGLAEGTLAVSFPNINEDIKYLKVDKNSLSIGDKIKNHENGLKIVCEGKEVPGVNINLVNDSMECVEEDTVGKIYISGDNVAEKFLINNVEVKSLEESGQIFTGDIGFRHKGEIYVIGRESELIVNGKNYFCSDAEEYIESKMKIKYKFVLIPVRMKEECRIVVFVKHKYDEKIVKYFSEIRDEVFSETAIMLDGIVFVDYIPKTTSGKIKRFELAKGFYEGNYGKITLLNSVSDYENDYSEMEKNILELFEKAYGEKPDINKDVTDLFNESIKNISFLVSIEEFYDLKLNFDDFMDVSTIKEICNKVNEYII